MTQGLTKIGQNWKGAWLYLIVLTCQRYHLHGNRKLTPQTKRLSTWFFIFVQFEPGLFSRTTLYFDESSSLWTNSRFVFFSKAAVGHISNTSSRVKMTDRSDMFVHRSVRTEASITADWQVHWGGDRQINRPRETRWKPTDGLQCIMFWWDSVNTTNEGSGSHGSLYHQVQEHSEEEKPKDLLQR